MEIKIIKMGINGEGIGYINNKPVFVAGAYPDETVSVKITDSYNTYQIGSCEKVIVCSEYRVRSVCRNRYCKSCTLIDLAYPEQLRQKKLLLSEALYKYANISSSLVEDVIENPKPTGYRNLMKLPVKSDRDGLVSGMYEPKSNHFVAIEDCVIHDENLDKLKKNVLKILSDYRIKEYDNRTRLGLRYLIIRGFDQQYQCTLVTGDEVLKEKLCDDLFAIPNLVSLNQSINTAKFSHELFGNKLTCLRGTKAIEIKLKNYVFRLSPTAFFQLNIYQAEQIYAYVASILDKAELVVDAYCGIGSMTFFIKEQAQRVIGIENNRQAISDAKANAKLNKIVDCEFVVGDAAEQLKRISLKGPIDAIVVNPPRSGLDEEMIESIIRSKPKQIVYVSCNPSTLAKNIANLTKYYNVEKVKPFDMFSHTPLVETVVSLKRKKG